MSAASLPPSTSVAALLFDLGGVVIEIDFERALQCWSAHANVSPSRLRSRFRFDREYERHERGEITAETYFESLRHTLGIDLTDGQFLDGWNAIFVGEVPGIADLLARVRRMLPTYAFTNSNAAHQRTWSRGYASALSGFERVFVSSEIGQRKPEPEAYARVCAEMGFSPEQVGFFDDSEPNVTAATALGMQAVHVRSIADIHDGLSAIGLGSR